jgi:hypothetical protein
VACFRNDIYSQPETQLEDDVPFDSETPQEGRNSLAQSVQMQIFVRKDFVALHLREEKFKPSGDGGIAGWALLVVGGH